MPGNLISTSFYAIMLLGGLILVSRPVSARAYITSAESIEWISQTSERIVVGKVAAVGTITGSDKNAHLAVTILISRTLKGAAADRETFVCDCKDSGYQAAEWSKRGSMLFFLNKNDGKQIPVAADKYPWTLREFDGAIWLNDPGRERIENFPPLTRGLEVLDGEKQILDHVAHVIESVGHAPTPCGHVVVLSWDSPVYRRINAGSAVLFTVPIDKELEALGRTWCKSDQPSQRVEGARILRYFNDRESIELLKSLLADDTNAESVRLETKLVYRKKDYYVREAAFSALTRMGVDVPKPVLSVLLEGHMDDPHADDDMDFDDR